jgi:N-acetylmuramoyl-L-alanine amidase
MAKLLIEPWRKSLRLWLLYAVGAASSLVVIVVPLYQISAVPVCGDAFSVTLDIGHTPGRAGAISSRGKTEYEFNQALALELAPALRVMGIETEILNEEGREISLAERAARLRAVRRGIIISLHHDSVQPQYLKRGVFEGKAVAFSRHAEGFSLFVSRWSNDFEGSKDLARSIGSALRKAGFVPSLHHAERIKGEGRPIVDRDRGVFRFDGLSVLKSAKVPAVLLEAGVIVNPEEERRLESATSKQRLVRAVVSGITSFCR